MKKSPSPFCALLAAVSMAAPLQALGQPEVFVQLGHVENVASIGFSPDGLRVLASDVGGQVAR
ncbi:MAG: hypothetical protein HY748_00310 [Elusimicrobia bacterium]|nr:hypothetical protein [Elusimicrobiota bacterium]